MSRVRDYIPDDWQSAELAGRQMRAIVSRTTHARTKVFIGLVAPFAAGAVLGLFCKEDVNAQLIDISMTTLGILAGFLMSLMLFTGRITGSESLDLDSACEFKAKILYLLWSQSLTFMAYLVTLILGIAWLLSESSDRINEVFAVLYAGGLATCFVRSALLPYQLFDMHTFSLDALITQKRGELKQSIHEQLQEIEQEENS